MKITTPGDLESLKLLPIIRQQLNPDEIEIRVHVSGLSFRDVLNAVGMRDDTDPLGSECAGEIVSIGKNVEEFNVGDEVLALAAGSLREFVITPSKFVMHKPPSMSFEDAAALPSAFLTAYYALYHSAKIKRGDRVLIHAATGGVGLAAVQLAQRAGAEIFATAGSPEKRAFLRSMGINHVMDSRSLDFAEEIMAVTNGRGVDVVLNSLAGDFIPKSLSVLQSQGRFLEIGKTNVWDRSQVAQVRPEASYHIVDIARICRETPGLVHSILRGIMASIKAGEISSLPRKVFSIREATSAFRYMARAKHIGKIVLSWIDIDRIQEGRLESKDTDGTNFGVSVFDSNGTYLITGGLGGLGLTVAKWMVERGANFLVLLGRSAPTDSTIDMLKAIEGDGSRVKVVLGDVSHEKEMHDVISGIQSSSHPLRGIIHCAGVLDDGILIQQNWDRFEKVMASKVDGAWNLHALTENLSLDLFVLFSSTASLLGSPGQGNHAAANAFLDALAHYRRANGAHAMSINWGPWSEVGAAASLSRDSMRRFEKQGIGSISPQVGMLALRKALGMTRAQIAIVPVQWVKFMRQFPAGGAPALLSGFSKKLFSIEVAENASAKKHAILTLLKGAPPVEKLDILTSYVRASIAKILGLDPSQAIDQEQPLSEMGIDSLMAVELRNLFSADLKLLNKLSATLIFKYPTIGSLANYLFHELLSAGETQKEKAKVQNPDRDIHVEAIESLSDDEAQKLLSDELDSLSLGYHEE